MSMRVHSPADPLRIAVIAPISWRVPPRHYGPWEQFVSLLTEGLVERGVDVTLFATADSLTTACLVGSSPTGYSEDPSLDVKVEESLHISAAFERAEQFDLIHNSCDFLPLSYSALVRTPVVTTIHGFSSPKILPVYQKYNSIGAYVAISDADRHPSLNYESTVHHGIDMHAFADFDGKRDYLLFFGRIHPDKGAAEAIALARRVGIPLIIAGIVQDHDYFAREVEPHIDGEHVRFIGSVGSEQRVSVLGGARALLHLIQFDEPFGFSVVEALACGTPVIANCRGSMPEIISHGENGYLVTSLDAAAEAVQQLHMCDPRRVRASVETRFDVGRMVDEYLAVYYRVLARTDLGGRGKY